MRRFAIIENGRPVAFYSEDVHGDAIPEEAVEIDERRYGELLERSAVVVRRHDRGPRLEDVLEEIAIALGKPNPKALLPQTTAYLERRRRGR